MSRRVFRLKNPMIETVVSVSVIVIGPKAVRAVERMTAVVVGWIAVGLKPSKRDVLLSRLRSMNPILKQIAFSMGP